MASWRCLASRSHGPPWRNIWPAAALVCHYRLVHVSVPPCLRVPLLWRVHGLRKRLSRVGHQGPSDPAPVARLGRRQRGTGAERREAVIRLPLRATTAVPTVWPVGTVEGVRGCERDPPPQQSVPYSDAVPPGLLLEGGMATVRLAALARGGWGVQSFSPRRGKRHPTGQVRGASRRVVA
jgi:hypothetical protein